MAGVRRAKASEDLALKLGQVFGDQERVVDQVFQVLLDRDLACHGADFVRIAPLRWTPDVHLIGIFLAVYDQRVSRWRELRQELDQPEPWYHSRSFLIVLDRNGLAPLRLRSGINLAVEEVLVDHVLLVIRMLDGTEGHVVASLEMLTNERDHVSLSPSGTR